MSPAPAAAAPTGIDDVGDLIVIRGGPAGSAAATLPAQQGRDVRLIEKSRHPRFPIGESLLPPSGHLLDGMTRRTATGAVQSPALSMVLSVALGLALALVGANAHADQPLWELGIGAAGLRLPHYRGSDQARAWVLPVPYVVYRGDIFKADREGARAVLLDTERFDFDLSFSASAPTSDDNRARRGMPDLKPTLEFGPNMNLRLARAADWALELRLPVRAVFTIERNPRSVGFQAAPHLNLDWRVQQWNLGLQGGPLFGNRARHAFFYDVAPAFATAERPGYRAGGGYAGWNAVASASRRFGSTWAGVYVRGDSLHSAVFEDSPLVKSRSNWSAGVALSWVFKVSDARVPDDERPGARR